MPYPFHITADHVTVTSAGKDRVVSSQDVYYQPVIDAIMADDWATVEHLLGLPEVPPGYHRPSAYQEPTMTVKFLTPLGWPFP